MAISEGKKECVSSIKKEECDLLGSFMKNIGLARKPQEWIECKVVRPVRP